ncbi:tyrosine-type recombinase/integrase [Nocardia sp. CDC153]|uniref:tyrosine-type recombinase/integrase n=1 Tax=Nocardia sp. CDC153 TaxID=3112167 RepID=UPI002DBDCDCF|nr:tyrosine-type recombinase/integrase [Nocardia sp. CDC153]MEC3957547.1 tyrosine-type recombinase/integrase [Nocardia sp. CDC153]
MGDSVNLIPLGVQIRGSIEERKRAKPFLARVRWTDPVAKKRDSKSQAFEERADAEEWIEGIRQAAARGVDPKTATATLKDYGEAVWGLAMRGVEPKTLDPYLAGWRRRIVPTLGHLPITMISGGVADRAVTMWIAQGHGKSTIKNTLAALGRVMDQAVRDEVIDRNRVEVPGWQRQYERHEDELNNPRALALPDWQSLTELADALVARSSDHYEVWGEVVIYEACTAARIGEVSGVRVEDIDIETWMWNLRRQTTPGPGGLKDKGTKGKRARKIPIIVELRPIVLRAIARAHARVDADPAMKNADEATRAEAYRKARLFVGPRGGRIQITVLRRATHWDEVVAGLGYEHLRRHTLRHTGLTWFADAGVLLHLLQEIAGHSDPRVTKLYLHPNTTALQKAGDLLSLHLAAPKRPPIGHHLRVVK